MKPVWIRICLLLVVMCSFVPSAQCQDTDSSEDEPGTTVEQVTANYFFNRVVEFVTNATGSLPSGEDADTIKQKVFGSNSRNWFQNLKPNDEYIASCGGMSTSAKTVWQNSDYPLLENLPGFCTLNLLPPAGTCALRVLFDDLDLQPAEVGTLSFGECPTSAPFFKATSPDDLTAVYCHKLDGYEGILPISDTTEPTILLLQLDPSAKFQFKVSVTAVNCKDITAYESPSDCGIKNQDLKTLRAELFGDLFSEETHEPAAAKYGDNLPLAYRQRRRNPDSATESQDQKNRRLPNKKQNTNNKPSKKVKTQPWHTNKNMHESVVKFQEALAIATEKGQLVMKNPNRIIGMQTSLVNEWPWIVFIERKLAEFDVVISCNGLLLDNSKVLTSRDCVIFSDRQPFGVADISVRIGAHDLDDTTEAESKTVKVSKVTVPLKNGIFDLKDAFAILHLKEEVELSENIRPICFPASYNKFDGSGVLAGWDFDVFSPFSPLPFEAKVTLWDEARCKKIVEDFFSSLGEAADVVCAADDKSGLGPVCFTEQGSALTQRDQRGAYYVTGMAGALNDCSSQGLPTVFSKIEPDNQFLNVALA